VTRGRTPEEWQEIIRKLQEEVCEAKSRLYSAELAYQRSLREADYSAAKRLGFAGVTAYKWKQFEKKRKA